MSEIEIQPAPRIQVQIAENYQPANGTLSELSNVNTTPFGRALLSLPDPETAKALLQVPESTAEISSIAGLDDALNLKADAADAVALSESLAEAEADLRAIEAVVGSKANAAHGHTIASIAGLQAALENLQSQISASSSSGGGSIGLLPYTFRQSSVGAGGNAEGSYDKLTDGSRFTGVGTLSSGFEWIEADLGSEKELQRLIVAGGEVSGWDNNVATYCNGAIVEVSLNALDWTPIFTISGVVNSRESEFILVVSAVRYVRLKKNSYLGTTEFKLIGR